MTLAGHRDEHQDDDVGGDGVDEEEDDDGHLPAKSTKLSLARRMCFLPSGSV